MLVFFTVVHSRTAIAISDLKIFWNEGFCKIIINSPNHQSKLEGITPQASIEMVPTQMYLSIARGSIWANMQRAWMAEASLLTGEGGNFVGELIHTML